MLSERRWPQDLGGPAARAGLRKEALRYGIPLHLAFTRRVRTNPPPVERHIETQGPCLRRMEKRGREMGRPVTKQQPEFRSFGSPATMVSP
jgi:hypothetical protein